jgi:acyl-CoA thioester hydrolase
MSDPRLFELTVRVYYEDTDAGGVVYHSQYLNFMERARTDWLRNLGFEQDRLREELGVVFPVSRMEIRFRRPARLDQLLRVTAQVATQGRAYLDFEQAIWHEETLLCEATVRVGCVDINRFKPVALPAALCQELTHAD